MLLGVFFFVGVFDRRRRAAHLLAFRTRSALCSALAPHLCRTCAASSSLISTASAVECDKSMSLYDHETHPVEPPSPGTVALAFINATQPQISRHAHHISFVLPPALRSHLRRLRVRFFPFDFDFTCGRRLCADPTAPTQFDSGASFVARVPATNPAVLTADTYPIDSRASGVGQLACFGLPLRERPCLGGKCQQARGCSWAFATMLGSS